MKIVNRFMRIVQTLRHLKPKQVYYQVYYRFQKIINYKQFNAGIPGQQYDSIPSIQLQAFPVPACVNQSIKARNSGYRFDFLNLSYSFEKEADWNFNSLGKLWTYNLNYFEFLFSAQCDRQAGMKLIGHYINKLPVIKDGLEPYPISLRCINWIKFLALHTVQDTAISNSLYMQYDLLLRRLEYHLLGNHLLENGFSLLFGGYYFQDEKLYRKGRKIVLRELEKQLLPDGGHFEQSPMYHQIILYRLLDVINLVSNNVQFADKELKESLRIYASRMLGWIKNITFSDGTFPCFNDSTAGITPDTGQLLEYAYILNVPVQRNIPLKESGFRMWKKNNIECCFDTGNVTATFQPGHTHADTFSFCLQADSKPVIVDTGISTYEKNKRRKYERSTGAHNTILVNGKNSSDVWGGFRLGKRALVEIEDESPDKVSASHTGYHAIGCTHHRVFDWHGEKLIIKDSISGNTQGKKFTYLLHFHPDCKVQLRDHRLIVNNLIIELNGFGNVFLETYSFCQGYNKLFPAIRMQGEFSSNVFISIGTTL